MGAPKISYTDITEKVRELPTLPTVVSELNRVIADPWASTKDVEKVMEQDQSLTLKVLALANSAYYAIPGGVSSLSRAIAYLGFDTVQQLVIAATVFDAISTQESPDFKIGDFWRHSIGTGIIAEVIAKKLNHPVPSDVFTCGILHDMGKLAMTKLSPELIAETAKHARDEKCTFIEAEVARAQLKHTQIGQILAEHWKLPMNIVNVVRFHHERNQDKRQGISQEMNQFVDIVMISNLICHAIQFGDSGYSITPKAPKEAFARLGIAMQEIPEIIKSLKEPLEGAESFLIILGS